MKSLMTLLLVVTSNLSFALTQDQYTIQKPPAELNEDMIIARYGNEKVTLGDYWSRIRFERWLFWRSLKQLAEKEGEAVLNLANLQNPYRETIQTIVNFLSNEMEFAEFVWERLTREAFYRFAARTREISVESCEILEAWAQLISWPVSSNCNDDSDFADARSKFINEANYFSDITDSALENSIKAQLLFPELREAVRLELPSVSEVTSIRARQIRSDNIADINSALNVLREGADFTTTMLEYGADSDSYGNSGDLGFVTRGVLTTDLDQVLFSANIGELIGPIESVYGFHIAQVMDTAPQLNLRHIQVDSSDVAETLRLEILAGADFASLAQQYSTDIPTSQNGGNIGYLTRTQLLPELEDTVFAASVGDLLGPLHSPFGYHLIEILDERPRNLLAQARLILVDSLTLAEQLLEELKAGANFPELVREYSRHQESVRSGGSIGYIRPDTEQLPRNIVDLIFSGKSGEFIGPIQNDNTFLLIQVTDLRDEAFAIRVRHILVNSEEQAKEILQSLNEGEEFFSLAREYSLDPSARGQDGDTLAYFTQGERRGSFILSEIPVAIGDVISASDVGKIIGPIETEDGYFIIRIEDRFTRFLNPLEMDEALDVAVNRWFQEQPIIQVTNQSKIWQTYLPEQPLPSDVSLLLNIIDEYLQTNN